MILRNFHALQNSTKYFSIILYQHKKNIYFKENASTFLNWLSRITFQLEDAI